MKTLKKALALIAGLIVLFFVLGYALPSKFTVSRSAQMKAPPERIYPYVATPKQWPEWSNWNPKLRPDMTFAYEGPEMGPGAAMRMTGEREGAGVLTIVNGNPKTGVQYQVKTDSGFVINGTIAFQPTADGTKVVWTDTGELSNPGMRYFGLFMDKMLAPNFEQGLAALTKKVEAAPATSTTAPAPAPAPAAPAAEATKTAP